MSKTNVPHYAKYSDVLLPLFWQIIQEHRAHSILDPMAGVGKIGMLRDFGFLGRIVAQDIEAEWAEQATDYDPNIEIRVCDAADMTWAKDGEFDAIVTSPTYGNRMADHHEAKDGSRRYRYRDALGRPLHPNNTGRMQWGKRYRETHERIWAESIRVLRPGGILVVNVKNHIRAGRLVRVSQWHADELTNQGLTQIARHRVDTPGLRNGSNAELRVDGEDVWVFQKGGGGCDSNTHEARTKVSRW